jgi:uncharacterized protein (DUF58 family)
MIAPTETFRHIRRLQIKALRNVEDVFAGFYRSVFKGQGLEFEEVREYQTGDDVRSIDWNVTARSQRPFVKVFREERELTVLLVVDISASLRFSHTQRLKSELIAEIAAILAFSAIKNQDNVGLLLFSSEVELYLKPKKGIRHVLRVIRELLYFVPKHKGTNLQKALEFLGQIQRKHAICFLISDFLVEKDFSKQATLLAQHHELIAFQVYDTYEQTFVPKGLLTLRDLETGEHITVDTADAAVQHHFEEKSHKRQMNLKRLFERIKVDLVTLNTASSSTEVLQRFFKLRGRKR